jgi:hypothetical protein
VRITVLEGGFDDGITPDLSDREVNGQRLVSVYATAFVLAVYAVSVALDVADQYLSIVAPKYVARLACAIQPFAIVAVPLSPPSSVSDACVGEFREPAISLTFLSVKLTMALFIFVVLWVCWNADGFKAMRDIYWRRFETPGGYRRELKSFAKNSLGIFVFLASCLLLASITAADSRSHLFIVGSKFILEDGVAVAIPLLAMNFIAKASLFAFFAWTHRNSGAVPPR